MLFLSLVPRAPRSFKRIRYFNTLYLINGILFGEFGDNGWPVPPVTHKRMLKGDARDLEFVF